ncbi:MAG: SGNH/GDSL hydrolase family protein [Planctomycetes bacterium]|nr:SGNH/GDSL hydrolase family protein [Planctomycetota bacterium]
MTTPADPAPADAPRGPRSVIGWRTLAVVVLLGGLEWLMQTAGARDWWGLGGIGHWVVTEQSERYGWVMLPEQQRWSRDMTVREDINAEGFRDREWAPPVRAADGTWQKDETLYRVAFVGNSMTYGTSVPVEETFARRLEDALRERFAAAGDPRDVLVMNFAVQGYVFEQMARVYEDDIRPYRPDLLVVPFHPHDIMPMKPSVDDPHYDFRTEVLRTATFDFLNRTIINRWIPTLPTRDRKAQKEWIDLDTFLTEQPFAREAKPYREAAQARMDEVLSEVEADGGHLAIVSLPRWRKLFQPQILGAESLWAGWTWDRRPRVVHCNPQPLFEPPMQPLVAEIRSKQLEAWTTHDLSELTWTDADGVSHPGDQLEHGDESLFLLHDTGHYTSRGHAVIAAALYADLVAGEWIPAP